MQAVPSPSETLTFIVRLWREMNAVGEESWRGRVEHSPSGEVCYVEDTAGVIRFLELWMTPDMPTAST